MRQTKKKTKGVKKTTGKRRVQGTRATTQGRAAAQKQKARGTKRAQEKAINERKGGAGSTKSQDALAASKTQQKSRSALGALIKKTKAKKKKTKKKSNY